METQRKFGAKSIDLLNLNIYSGADFVGGWGFGRFLPQGFEPLPTQRVPLCTISRYPFLARDPKIFLKAPLAPVYTNFEGGALAEKTQFFWLKLSKKCLKTPLLACFFKILHIMQLKMGQCSNDVLCHERKFIL